MANWVIDPSKNEGYPSLTVWPPEWQTDYTSSDTIRYPDYMWRIKSGVNEDYPWIYPWFKEDSSDSGDMEIGGSQTNYPNGFSYSDDGGVRDQFNNDTMPDNDVAVAYNNSLLANALSGKMFALTTQMMHQVLNCLNNPSLLDSAKMSIMSSLYGANIYDGILTCKVYPFQIQILNWPTPAVDFADVYGIYPLYDSDDKDQNMAFFTGVYGIQSFNMGSVILDVRQAWEVENITWSIYLPFAGIFPIDVRAGDFITLSLHVDMFTGVGEYTLRQNRQITNSWKCQLGYDFPLNTVAGQLRSNMAGSVVNTVMPLLSAGTATLGKYYGVDTSSAEYMYSQLKADKMNVNAPQVGGLTSVYSYPKARIIARIPKMFNGGFGYRETLGDNRSTTFVKLNTCSGFVQCENYKTDIILATTPEKEEIERLMNTGVFL